MSSDLQKWLDKEDKEATEKEEKLNKVKTLSTIFKNLKRNVNRWGTERFCTNEVNETADKYYTTFSCGCCSDAALLVRPYKEVAGIKVYTDPCDICIGEKDYSYTNNARLDCDWRDALREKGISEAIIEQIEEEYNGSYDDEDW